MVTVDEVSKLKVADLKEELKKLDLPVNGLKAQLASRLTEALEHAAEEGSSEPDVKDDAAEEANTATKSNAAIAEPHGADARSASTPVGEPDQAEEEPVASEEAAVVDLPDEKTSTGPEDSAAAAATAADGAATDVAKDVKEDSAGADDDDPSVPEEAAPTADKTETPPSAPAAAQPSKPIESESKAPKETAAAPAESKGPSPEAHDVQTVNVDSADPRNSESEVALKSESQPAAANKPEAEDVVAAAAATAADKAAGISASTPSTSIHVETRTGPEIEEDDGAPEVDFEMDVEEEVAEVTQAAKAAVGDRKRKAAASGDARESIKAARLSSDQGTSTPRSGRPSGGMGSRIGIRIPSPNRAATRALLIDGLMRPFTKSQLEELLSQEGCQLESLWLPTLKTHCYALFQSTDNAETIRQSSFGLQWPQGSQKRLTAKFVDEEEALSHINGTAAATPKAAPSEPPAASRASEGIAARLSSDFQGVAATDARQEIMDRRTQRQVAAVTADSVAQEPPPAELGLDDLFRKTNVEPFLYWLPSPKAPPLKAPAAAIAATVSEAPQATSDGAD